MAIQEFPAEVVENFITGMKLTWFAANQIQVAAGSCMSDDNTKKMKLLAPCTADLAIVGLNGRDAGVEAPNTWYYVFVIMNLATGVVGLLLSTSSTAPVLPAGFTLKRRIGVIRNNAASNIVDFKQFAYGNRRRYEIWLDMTGRRVLAAGGNAAWTVVGCATLVPPTADVMWLNVLQTVAGISANVRSMGNVLELGGKGRGFNSVYVSLFTNTQQFQYKNSIAGGATYIEVCDFEEEI